MKKFYLLIFTFFVMLNSWSQQLLYEPFNYTPDPTNGIAMQSGGVWVRINTGDSILVDAGNLSYTGLSASTGNKIKFDGTGSDDYRVFTSQTTGSVYMSFIVNVSALGSMNTTGSYFTGFIQAASTSSFGATVWTRLSTTAGKYNIGVSTRSNSAVSWLPGDLDPGTAYFVVVAYDIVSGAGNDVARIWLNTSAIGGAEPAADATSVVGTDLSSVERVLLRQDAVTTTPFIEMDEIRVGTTWASVTPSSAPTPTLTAIPTTIPDFGSITVGTNSTSQSFNLSGANLTGAPGTLTVTAPSDFQVSNDNSTWGASTTIAYASATLTSTPVYVRFTPQSAGPKSGNVTVSGGGATTINVAVSGTGVAPTPVLSASALTAFGNVCINTTAGPNSFTITGSNLTTANVTVGPLTGYTFSTTAGGTYTTSLSLAQPGGSYSQQIFVNFTPTAVQSYNGSIAVSGGGASTFNVAASGSGVNTTPSVVTGAASSITTNSATAAGSITANGCSAVTAYGIEWSTTSGFANGTGTQVASTNLSGGNFSSNLSGLSPNTTYYYKAYATNNGGTAYGAEQSFTTLSLSPALSATTLTAFGNVCINTTAGPNSFTINGSALTTANITVGPLSGFTFSTTAGGTYSASLSLTQPGGTYTQTIYVQFSPTAVQSYDGNIPVGGGGATTVNVAASGSGVNSAPSVTTGGATSITSTSATAAGSITSTGCSAITAYGIEWSTTNGFANGTGTQVAATNLSGGNFSSNLTGLAPGTVYYFKAYATNSGGTTYGAQQTFTTPSPTLSASALTAFGNICLNTTAGPNSFTITGTNLTTANVTVGALAGYTFSTTSGGTYTASLNLTQPGGSYSQQIFVKFTPTAVQSYNGNIAVGGGGATVINVAASGAGVNSAPSVTTGAASAITYNSATAAGSITATGCTAITTYGIEYSTTNGFANGTGTKVASTNLSGGNFSSNLTGLAASTIYYYKAYATNGGGTTYGAQQTFTTLALPVSLTTTALTAFGNVCINSSAGPNSFTINGAFLNTTNIVVGPLTGYTFSTSATGPFTSSLSLTQPGGTYTQIIYVKLSPTAVQSYNGNIPVSGGGAPATSVAASGSGVNTAPTVVTSASYNITNHDAVLEGKIPNPGCSNITLAAIEYSGIRNFANGTGTPIVATNLSAGVFSVLAENLVQGAKYYYRAYATNSGGTVYGNIDSFTVKSIPNDFSFYPVPAVRGQEVRITMKNVTPGNYSLQFFSMDGRLVHQVNFNIQADFINQGFYLPAKLPAAVYRVQLVNFEKILAKRSIMIF